MRPAAGAAFVSEGAARQDESRKTGQVFQSALEYCRRLQAEPALQRKIEFRFDEFEITLNDRLLAPNGDESYQAFKGEIEPFVSWLYGGAPVSLQQERARAGACVCEFSDGAGGAPAPLGHVESKANGQAYIN
jgi:hypothetical protein